MEEMIDIPKSLFNQLVTLWKETDYQLRCNFPSIHYLENERNITERLLRQHFPDVIE